MPFSSLPPELRHKIWEYCLPDRPRYVLLAIALQVAGTNHTSRPVQESIVIGGSFTAGQTPFSIPVFPLPLQGLVETLGVVCYESRSVALEHYPDLIRVDRPSRATRKKQHGSSFEAEELLLRCNLRTDLFWIHALAIGWWYFADHKQFAVNVYESVRSFEHGAERADEFRAALRKINHVLLVSFKGTLLSHLFDPLTPTRGLALHDSREDSLHRSRHLLFEMSLLKSLTFFDLGEFGEGPFDRARESLGVESLPRNSAAGRVKRLYDEYKYRFVSPACYNTSLVDISTLVEDVMREQPDQDSKEFDELLDKRLKELGFDNHSRVIKELEVKPGPRRDGQQDEDALTLPEFFQIVKLDDEEGNMCEEDREL